jgi:hypothetical protein
MADRMNTTASEKPVYEKPVLVCYGSLRDNTKTVTTPLPGQDLLPDVELYGDPS